VSDEFFTAIADRASELIIRFGRDLTLVRQSRDPVNPSKPWNGPGTFSEETLILQGVFAPPNQVRQFGITALGEGTEFMDLMSISEQIIIVNSYDNDLRDYRIARDGSVDWGIIGIQTLKPGKVGLISFLEVRR